MSKSIKHLFACIVIMLGLGACNKESLQDLNKSDKNCETELKQESERLVRRPFKMTSDTWYRISPTAPAPVASIPGQISFANVPGGGTGNATHMGGVTVWFNQLAYSPDGLNPPSGTVSAPVVHAISYPILFPGAPLPLIQPGDFPALALANSWLQLPESVNGYIVNTVIYNENGDAVFLAHTTPSQATIVSAQRVNFSGEGMFVGGRGKFSEASGTYRFNGYFNLQNPNDAGYEIDGSIAY